jgi:hypothetical protein
VAADSLPPLAAVSPAPLFAVPPAEVPPAGLLLSLAPPELPPLGDASSLAFASSTDELGEASLDLAVEVVEVVEVEVLCTAAASALVSVGGVMSGVLFGTASLTLPPPPQAASPTAHSSKMPAASQTFN